MSAGGTGNQIFYGNVAPPRLPRPPAFEDYYAEEWPPPRREWSERLQRQNSTQRYVYYDNSTMQRRQRQEAYYDYSGLASSVEPALHQEHRRPIMLRQPMRSHKELWMDSAGMLSYAPRAVRRGQG